MRIGKVLIGVGVVAGLALIGAIIYGYAARPGWVGGANKTLWDWLQLLIIPFVLAVGGTVGGYYFTRSENRATQAIAERRAQDEVLQAYLDQIGELLLDEERPLRDSNEGDEVRILARARTLTVLARLDGRRKATIVQFLYESRLITGDTPIIQVGGANLRGVDLAGAKLQRINLTWADLRTADLRADLEQAILVQADLRGLT